MKKTRQTTMSSRQQRGIVTLLVAVLLLTVATLASMAVGKAIYFEQRLTGNDLRAKEVLAAAQHGLEFGMEYLAGGNTIGWSGSSAGATATLPMANTDHGQSGTGTDSYTHTITAEILTDLSDATVVEIRSTATGVADGQVSRTVSNRIVMIGILSSNGGNAPPIVVEGCMTGVTGTPDISHPSTIPAVSSLSCTPCGAAPCIDTGGFDAYVDGSVTATDPETTNTSSSDSLWDTLFSITKDQFRSMATKYPERFINVNDGYETAGHYSKAYNGSTWNDDTGTAKSPVIMFIEASEGCPKINGDVDIVGLIYFDDPNCASHGFGKGKIQGTIAVSGSLTKHTANTDINYFPLGGSFGGGGAGAFNFVSVVPGSWKDF